MSVSAAKPTQRTLDLSAGWPFLRENTVAVTCTSTCSQRGGRTAAQQAHRCLQHIAATCRPAPQMHAGQVSGRCVENRSRRDPALEAAHLLAQGWQHQGEARLKRSLPVCPQPQRHAGRLACGAAALHTDGEVGGGQAPHLRLRQRRRWVRRSRRCWRVCGWRCAACCSLQRQQISEVDAALQQEAELDVQARRQRGGGSGAGGGCALLGEPHAAWSRCKGRETGVQGHRSEGQPEHIWARPSGSFQRQQAILSVRRSSAAAHGSLAFAAALAHEPNRACKERGCLGRAPECAARANCPQNCSVWRC